MKRVSRGEVWLVDLGATTGREQAGARPALVVSIDGLNQGPAELAIILPLTSRERPGFPSRVEIVPPEGGLKRTSYVICEQIRAISILRFRRRLGAVSAPTLERSVGFTLDLIQPPR